MTATHLNLIPKSEVDLSAKDFKSDQEVRWCPGCGDFGVLASLYRAFAQLDLDPIKTVVVSGIGFTPGRKVTPSCCICATASAPPSTAACVCRWPSATSATTCGWPTKPCAAA